MKEVRVKIPRIRNGDIAVARSANADEEKARLLGILALMIAERSNPHMFYFDSGTPEVDLLPEIDRPAAKATINERIGRDSEIETDRLKEVMTYLLENDLDSFFAILQGMQEQAEADRDNLILFSVFVDRLA